MNLLDLDEMSLLLAELRRVRQRVEGLLPLHHVMDLPDHTIAARQLNQVSVSLAHAVLDLRTAIDIAAPGTVIDMPGQRP